MNITREALWTPSKARVESSRMSAFAEFVSQRHGNVFSNYSDLHAWSVLEREQFWESIWEFCDLIGERGERALNHSDMMPGAQFFPDAKVNYAENMLAKAGSDTAIVFRGEDKVHMEMTWDELRGMVSQLQQTFAASGVQVGDRIAAMVPNHPHTLACMLAANSLGAIWSSCSPDFGEQGVLDRFGQIEPVLFIACDAYWYNGKQIDVADKVSSIADQLTARQTIIIDYLGNAGEVAKIVPNGVAMVEYLAACEVKPLTFERLPFDHPLYILFSSGTTGIPKCIVHSQGGILLQHAKEHALHCDISEGDRVFYFTTCGWMMWNWLVSALVMKATLMLYDGSPFYPDGVAIFDYAEQEKFTFFGTSAKFIDAVRNEGRRPIEIHDLSSVRTIASTGSPLAPENFSFVYEGIKQDVHLASVSGGTDIAACFVGAVPWQSVYSGEIQGPCLGMATEVWNEDGHNVRQLKGELVCTRAFPSMPVQFWNDPDGHKYHEAYFDRYDNVWCHGDFAEWTDTGGMIIHGRSDATLNPGGVRIGTAEIYNQVEQMPQIEEALCIGQDWESDTRVVLFVRLASGAVLDDALCASIKSNIRSGASPRHVPAVIIEVSDIPRTKSGKITELAVRDIVHGRSVNNQEALANPEALSLFENLPQLQA